MLSLGDPASTRAAGRGSAGRAWRQVRALTALFVAIALAELLFWLGADAAVTPWWVSMVYPLFYAAATARCLRTASHLEADERRAWVYFGLGCASFGFAELAWGIFDSFLGLSLPSPSLADVGYVVAPLLLMAGLWYLRARTHAGWFNRVQLGNLGVIFSSVILAYAFLSYGFVQAPISPLTSLIGISYGILDLSVALLGFLVVFSGLWSRKRVVVMLILLALVANAAADVYYSHSLASGGYDPSGPMNLVNLLVASLFYWAASERSALGPNVGSEEWALEAEERAKQWETLIPASAVLGVLGVAFLFRKEMSEALLPYVTGASIVFVASLALRNWSGHRMEVELRQQARASELDLQAANRELRSAMRARARIEEELRQAQKMEALGHLTGGVAHDFNNLLAVILGNLELAEQTKGLDASVQEHLREAIEAADRGAALTQRLLTLSRKQALRPEPIAVGALLRDMQSLFKRSLGEQIRVELGEVDPALHCLADRAQLEGALLNLAINARDAMADGGTLSIRAEGVELGEAFVARHPEASIGDYVVISMRDTGTGIDADIMSKVFEPFFTTKEVNEGTGLGLSMVYGFARQSGGFVSIDSALGEGTEVCIYLPAAVGEARAVEDVEMNDAWRARGESILVVEDDPAVRRFVIALLEDLGYDVHMAGDSQEALAILDSMRPVDLLLSDVVLPGGLSGRGLARRVSEERPRVKVLLMSGYAARILEREGSLQRGEELIYKPFRKADLARRLRLLLDAEGPAHGES